MRVCKAMQEQPAFQDWANRLKNRHDLLHGLLAVEIPGISQKLEHRSAALRHHRTQFDNRLHGAELIVRVSARSADAGPIAAAQRVENFWDASFHDITRSTEPDADRASIDQAVCYGVGVPHLEFAPGIRSRIFGKNKNVRTVADLRDAIGPKFMENPFVLETPSLETVFWEPNLKNFCEVGEKKLSDALSASHLEDIYDAELREWVTSVAMPEHQGDWSRTIKTYHLETAEYIYDVLDAPSESGTSQLTAHLLEFLPNLIERPWYSLMPGHENSEYRVAERYEPLIGPLYEAVQVLNITGTLMLSGALQTGRNTLQLVRDGARGAEDFMAWQRMPANDRPVLIALTDAAVQQPPPGYHYEPMPVVDQEQLIRAHQMMEEKLDRWGFPSALATDQPLEAGATSGSHAARQMESASDFLEPALRNRAKCWREQFLRMGDAIQALEIPVTIPVFLKAQGRSTSPQEMITIHPKDFRELSLDVEFKSVPATVQYAMRESDIRLLEMGRMSPDTFMERHFPDPLEEQKKIDLAQLREPVKQMALQAVLAVVQQSAAAQVEEAAAEAGVPPAPVASPAGGPAPGQDVRNERPPGGASEQGLGTPLVIPEQPEVAGGVPPSVGIETTGVAQ